jgi:hypothetical protein
MKPIILSRHASLRIAERNLRLDWIERAVRDPLRAEPDPADDTVERRFQVIEEADGRLLRVAVRETKASIYVISVHFDRGATRRHARKHLRS